MVITCSVVKAQEVTTLYLNPQGVQKQDSKGFPFNGAWSQVTKIYVSIYTPLDTAVTNTDS